MQQDTSAFVLSRARLDDFAKLSPAASLVDQIFGVVAGAVQSGHLTPGLRVPAIREVSDVCEVSRDTASRAYDKLVAQGFLISRRGAGFFVRSTVAKSGTDASQSQGRYQARGLNHEGRFRLNVIHPPRDLKSSSGLGYLPDNWLDEQALASALRSVARSNHKSLALPGDPQGYLPLRKQLQMKLQDIGIEADPGNVIVTSGAMEAINLLIQTFMSPGESVILEEPCQPVLPERLMASGLQPRRVLRLRDGPDVATLRKLCESDRPRFFFCQPLLHNPTSRSLSPKVAFEILRLAEEFDLTIIEDDSYGDLVPATGGSPFARLAPLDQLRRVIYIGSFTKTLPAGLRVGYLAASPERMKWLITYRALFTIASSSLAERVVYRLLSEGAYRHHCEQLRSRLAELRPRVFAAIRSHGFAVQEEAEAGLFAWADIGKGVNTLLVAQRLLEQGHLLAPGRLFAIEMTSHMRFNIASTLDNEALSALKRLVGRA